MVNESNTLRFCALAASWGMFLGMLASACTGGLSATGETVLIGEASLPAPTGTPIREAAAVSVESPREWIAAPIDRTVAASSAPGTRWLDVEVDRGGRVYTLDVGTSRVRVFDTDGEVVGWGTDAGLEVPAALAVAADRVVVTDLNPLRWVSWDLRGDRLPDAELERFLSATTGLDDGTVVTHFMEFGPLAGSVSSVAADGREVVRFTDMPVVEAMATDHGTRDLWPDPTFAAGGGHVYVTSADAYEVLAYDYDGQIDWALRVPWPRDPIPEEFVQRSLERSRRAGRAMRTNINVPMQSYSWPEHFPALAGVAVDGHGRLYVFPYVAEADAQARYPVDVYSPDGELLVNGLLPFPGWDAAHGDRVYRLEQDAEVARIVAYRLQFPAAAANAALARVGR